MDPLALVAILGVVAGGAYLVLAVVAYTHSRRLRESGEGAPERMVMTFEDETRLVEGEPTFERMRKLALICADATRTTYGEQLDFTPTSIGQIDRAITATWGAGGNAAPSHETILGYGAYLGEVIVRSSTGRWVTGMTESDPATILFLAPDDEAISASPFMLVREKFENIYGFDLSVAHTALEQRLKELKAG